MSNPVTRAVQRIKELKPYLESLRTFTGGVALARTGLEAKNHADYHQRGLRRGRAASSPAISDRSRTQALVSRVG